MPQVHYPFIDVAVHPAIRQRFAAGDAVVLFSRDMDDVLWANGEGARLFGHPAIYDLIERGPERGGVAFRQLAAASAQLAVVGDQRRFIMRTTSGFKSTAVQAEVGLLTVGHEETVLFSAPAANANAGLAALLSGFDDPDTHMALLSADGEVLAASDGYAHVGVMPDTARALIAAASRSVDGLVKRPIPSGSGYLPAAIGALADNLYLLFCVETSIGRMDAPEHRPEADAPVAEADVAAPAPAMEEIAVGEPLAAETVAAGVPVDADELGMASESASDLTEPVVDDHSELEEAAAEDDVSDLAVLDGASADDIAAAAAETSDEHHPDLAPATLESDARDQVEPLQATELASDIDSAQAAEAPIVAPDVQSSELAADMMETSSLGLLAPDAFVEANAMAQSWAEAAAEQAPSDGFAPATDIGDAVDPGDAGAESAHVAAIADIESPSLAEDIVEAVDTANDAPEDFEEAVTAEEYVAEAERPAGQDHSDTESVTAIVEAPADAALPEDGDESVSDDEVPEPFEFDRMARPVRFVWKLNADGRFAEVSQEFAKAVGPHSGDIVGQSFRDLASLFKLDPGGEIVALLDRRDTWSGRTIKWPVEGTELVVPVDLAALPTYSRNREFDGFRGFGIIRVSDAEADPQGFGLKIAASAMPDAASEPDDAVTADDSHDSEIPPPMDEFRGEVPALNIVSNPLATFSEKIVQLEERRARNMREGLSAGEQAALKEIARRLEPFGKRPNDDIVKSTSGLLQTEDDASADTGADADDEFLVEADADDQGPADEGVESVEAGDVAPSDDDAARMDEARAQSLFEDLGTGQGLTADALDQVPMAILIHAGDRLIEANGEFRRLTGYSTLNELDRVGGLDALITRREGPDAGVYLVRADGMQVLVSARLQSVRYEGSSALMLALTPAAGTLAAVTTEPQYIAESEPARKLAALKVEVDELRSILETATDGVIVLDTEGRIRSLNRSASALFNFDDAEVRGKPFAMLFAHESQKSVQDYLSGLADHGVASVLNDGREVIGREAAGGFIPLFMTMGRMPGSNSYCAVIRDITQWKRSEEELRTAKRAAETANQHKSDFLARVSHEIRTPLNAIIGFSDMIASEHFGPAGHPRYVEYATDIGRSGRHVLDIVNDLLDISKIEAGEMDLEFGAVGINDCISEAVSLVQPQANSQRVIIRTSLSQSVPEVVADLRSIKQIALNILANAIRYTPSGGQIVVSTAYEPSGSVSLRIRDTGVGMSKAELEQAMRPFGQVASGTRQRGDGTGLGLPLTKAMTEANRATFSIHSAPNEGTLVEITFPPQRVLAD
jgi:PAS domain S-box-containing protein